MTENELAEKTKEASVPAIHLTAVQNEAPSESRTGGLPDVPARFAWPMWKEQPLAFIAQIDLSTIRASHTMLKLPETGLLCFFYDQEQSTWGFDPADRGSWSVIYSPNSRDVTQATPPDGLSEDSICKEILVEPTTIRSVPSCERLDIDVPDKLFDREEELRLEAMRGGPAHQIGGFPNPVQSDDMELECQLISNGIYCGDASQGEDPRVSELEKGASDWKLLL